MKGKIIVIEGTDCSGKETQSILLEENLKKNNIKCFRMSFPVYDSPTGKIVGGDYLGKPEIGDSKFLEGAVNVDPHIACLYYAADRKYNIDKAMKYLDEGYVVILDRYISSNQAHQGSKIHDKDERFNMYQWIDKLEYWLLNLPKPDYTIFLHVPYEYSHELMKNRKFLFEHEKSIDHLMHAEEAYLELAGLYNWKSIECIKDYNMRKASEISDEIINYILDNINK